MKAFSFLNGSKKTQQQQHPQRQRQGRTQLSINTTPRSSQDNDPFYSSQLAASRTTGVQSPAYSTISFFSSKSASSRAGSGANTPEPSQSMHASESGSGRSNGSHSKLRPSLTLLRPRMSSDSNHHSSAEHSQKAGSGGRLNIYNRFGFSKSSSQLPQDMPSTPTYPTPPPLPAIPVVSVVPALPSTEPVTPNRQYQLLHQQMFPEEPAPVEPRRPVPRAPQIDREPSPTRLRHHSPPKTIDGHGIPALDDPASTSLILQRRRAKSLGNANPGSSSNHVTALKIPTPVVEPAPPLPPSRADSTKSSSIPRPINMHMPPPKSLTTVLPPTPMSSASSLTSEQPINSLQTPNRMRSESNSTRSRSESSSSRARSESNSSSASSSRHGHGHSTSYKARSSKTAMMGRLDDFWDGFLKEIDEDITDLCLNSSPVKSATPAPKRPARLEEHDIFLGPEAEEVVQTVPVVTRSRAMSSPLRKGTAKLMPEPTPAVASKSNVQTITIPPKSDLKANRSLRSPPMTAPLVKIARSPDINGYPTIPFKKSASHNSVSSLPYLNSPGSSFKRFPDPSNIPSPQMRGIQTQNSPTFVRSPSPANLRSPDPSSSQPTTPQPAIPRYLPQEAPSPVVESQDSRPDSAYSQCSQASRFSQFSLSLFPSPPSVPLVRPTTEIGTFRTGRAAAPPPPSYKERGQVEVGDAGTLALRFKPIVPSTRTKPPVRPVLFERDENGQAMLSMPLTTPRFARTPSDYSSASSSSASSAGTETHVGSDSITTSSYIGTTTSVTHVDRHLGN